MSNHYGSVIPSTSFLEYAFLRWILTPACNEKVLTNIKDQKQVSINNHSYKIDYVLEGSQIQLAIELDGFAYHGSRKAFSYDRLRQNDLHAAGYTVIRFSYDSVRSNTKRCVQQLHAIMQQDSLLADFINPSPLIQKPEMNPNSLFAFDLPPHLKQEMNYFDLARSCLSLDPLRECQQHALIAIGNYFANGGQDAACIMSVGAGKTALGVVSALAYTKRRTLILTPGSVIRGTFDTAFDKYDKRNVIYHLPSGPLLIGCESPKVLTLSRENGSISQTNRQELLAADIIITNFHTLGTGEDAKDLLSKLEPEEIDLIIVDEAHIAAAESYQRAFSYFAKAKTLLMSACFERLDGKPIEADIVYRYQLINSIIDGHAKRIRVQRFQSDPEASIYELQIDGELEIIQGRDAILELIKNERKLANVTAKSEQPIRNILQVVKAALEQQKKELYPIKPRVLLSALGKKHAEQVARLACEEGIETDFLHYSMGEARIRTVKDRYESPQGDLEAIVQLKMLGQGYDFPNISIVVQLRPYGSFGEFYQFIGRGIRTIRDDALKDKKQYMDVILHSEMGLDNHIQSLFTEKGLPPRDDIDFEEEDYLVDIDISEQGQINRSHINIEILFEEGDTEEQLLHPMSKVEIQQKEQHENAFAQRYTEYVQKASKPVSFDEYLKIMRRINNDSN